MAGKQFTLFVFTAMTLGMIAEGVHAGCTEKLMDVDDQLETAELQGVTLQQFNMLRDQAEMFCTQGQEALAMQFLTGLEQEISRNPSSGHNPKVPATKSVMSDDYLAGTWCAMVTQEQAEITFKPDGTYSACFHDSMQGRFGHCTKSSSTKQWLSSFKQARVIGPDQFALGNSVRSTNYKRGKCSEHGI